MPRNTQRRLLTKEEAKALFARNKMCEKCGGWTIDRVIQWVGEFGSEYPQVVCKKCKAGRRKTGKRSVLLEPPGTRW